MNVGPSLASRLAWLTLWPCVYTAMLGCTSILGDFQEGPSGNPDGSIADGAMPGSDASDAEGGTGPDSTPPVESGADASRPADAAACEAGLTSCVSGCVDLTSTPTDCGTCGNDCGGTTCTKGMCAPLTITAGLATTPYGVAEIGGQVFWARSGAVEKCPATGCTGPAATISGDGTLTSAGLVGGTTIVTDGNYVDWLAADPTMYVQGNAGPVIYSCPTGGCPSGMLPRLAAGTGPFTQLGLVKKQVYANLDSLGGTLYTCPIDSCEGAPLTTTLNGAGSEAGFTMISDGTTLFYYSGDDTLGTNGVVSCPLTGCPSGPLQLFPGGNALALSGNTLYATQTDSTIVSCTKSGCVGTPTVIAANQAYQQILSMVTDATHLYYSVQGSSTTANGEIRVCDLPACAGGPSSRMTGLAQPVSMVMGDDGFLYWVNAGSGGVGNSVMRVRP